MPTSRFTVARPTPSISHRTIASVALALGGLLVRPTPAFSQTIFAGSNAAAQTARTNFLATILNPNTQNFDSFSLGATSVNWNFGGGTATLAGGLGIASNPGFGAAPTSAPNGYFIWPQSGAGTGLLSLSRAVRGFGMFVSDNEGPITFRVSLVGGSTQDLTLPAGINDGVLSYFGVQYSSASVLGVQIIDDPNDSILLDDLTIDPTVVPEPASFVLVAAGLLGVAGVVLRRRTRRV